MGKPVGKPWENGCFMVVLWDLMGFGWDFMRFGWEFMGCGWDFQGFGWDLYGIYMGFTLWFLR